MAVASLAEVQQWLERTKIEISSLNGQLEDTARLVTFAELAQTYDVTDWLDELSTPMLVSKIVSLRYAGWEYKKVYSEDDDESPYGDYLLSMADKISVGLVSGSMDLGDVPGLPSSSGPASFYPDADTGRIQQRDDSGFAIGGIDSSAAKFRMGTVF